MNLSLKAYDTIVPEFVDLTRLFDRELAQRSGEFGNLSNLEGIHDVIVAWRGRDAVGCAALRELGDGVWEVKSVFVLPEYRGVGLSRQMMASLEELARGKGATRLVLETHQALVESVALYTNMAYRVIPNFGAYQTHPTSVCFEKLL